MGTGKVLPTIIIFSIAAMMVFSLLPVYADNVDGSSDGKTHGKCNGGGWNGPFSIAEIINTFNVDPSRNDRNGNDHVCFKFNPNAKLQFKDDNPIPK